MPRAQLTPSQVDLLLHAGVFGLCRVPANAVEEVAALRQAGLVELDDDRCFQLTPDGEQRVRELGGRVESRLLH